MNLAAINNFKKKNADATTSKPETKKTQEEIKKEIDKILDSGTRTTENDTQLCHLMYQEQNPDLVMPPPPINAPITPIKYAKVTTGRVGEGSLLTTEPDQIMAIYREDTEGKNLWFGASFKNAQIDKITGYFSKDQVEIIENEEAIKLAKENAAKKAADSCQVNKTVPSGSVGADNPIVVSAEGKAQQEEAKLAMEAKMAGTPEAGTTNPLYKYVKMKQMNQPWPYIEGKMRNALISEADIKTVRDMSETDIIAFVEKNRPPETSAGGSTRKRSQRKYKKNRRSNKKRKMSRGKGKGKGKSI
jgi:hypothetical protein